MQELIDRQALKNHLYRAQAEAFKRSEWYVAGSIQSFIDLLDKQPTIEPEVRHGRWENIPGMNNTVFCSECLAAANKELAMKYKGCPFCLARMGGGDNGVQHAD